MIGQIVPKSLKRGWEFIWFISHDNGINLAQHGKDLVDLKNFQQGDEFTNDQQSADEFLQLIILIEVCNKFE